MMICRELSQVSHHPQPWLEAVLGIQGQKEVIP
jgi:hypothetical protein